MDKTLKRMQKAFRAHGLNCEYEHYMDVEILFSTVTVDKKEIRALLKDNLIITQEIAEKLEKAFDMPPKYWFGIQKDLAQRSKNYGTNVRYRLGNKNK